MKREVEREREREYELTDLFIQSYIDIKYITCKKRYKGVIKFNRFTNAAMINILGKKNRFRQRWDEIYMRNGYE